jgi:hypothetical protein
MSYAHVCECMCGRMCNQMNECKLRNQGLSFLQILHVTGSRAHRTFFFSYLFLVLFLFA